MSMRSAERSGGFTLVEVLVGTTLLAIMISLLMGSLFSMGRSARAGESRLDSIEHQRAIRNFLRDRIAGAVPLTERADKSNRVYFDGRRDSIRFVGHLPAHHGGGGLQLLQVDIDSAAANAPVLVLRYRNAWTDVGFASVDDGPEWQRTVLLEDVASIRFRYYGSDDAANPARWTDRWVDRASLPSLVELVVEPTSGREWPELSIAIRTPTPEDQPRLVRRTRS